jgi:hypothetical protein
LSFSSFFNRDGENASVDSSTFIFQFALNPCAIVIFVSLDGAPNARNKQQQRPGQPRPTAKQNAAKKPDPLDKLNAKLAQRRLNGQNARQQQFQSNRGSNVRHTESMVKHSVSLSLSLSLSRSLAR